MYQIENEKFGEFIAQLRKEQNMTQRDLAERLFVSDKTVSKWERGLSLPNVSLLIPIADVLGVTVTELLKGERIPEERSLIMEEVEGLVTCSAFMSAQEQEVQQKKHRKCMIIYVVCSVLMVLEILLFISRGTLAGEMKDQVVLVSSLMLLLGGWFCLFARETLPVYYDENKINYVSDGIFRMNIPGMHFNNSNWPHILTVCRVWTLGTEVMFPAVYNLMGKVSGNAQSMIQEGFVLWILACLFVPIYAVGKKYE